MEYASYVSAAVSITGQLLPNGVLRVTRNVRDVDNDCTKAYFTPYAVNDCSIEPLCPPVDTLKYDLEASSGDGSVIVRMSSVDATSVVEIVRGGSLTLRIDASESHGKAIGDNWFGGYSFSSDGSRLVYVAVPKKPKVTTFFDKQEEKTDKETSVHASANKYDYTEDWGEKYTGISDLRLYVLDVTTGDIQGVAGAGGVGETVGQPAFTPDGSGVVYTAWPTSPKRLGMIYCYQRPCSIKVAYLTSESVFTLTPHLSLARYPVFAPSTSGSCNLIFLGSKAGFDMHNNSVQLFAFDFLAFQTKKEIVADMESYCRIVVDDVPGGGVNIPASAASDVRVNGYPFPGLFAGGLRPRAFISDEVIMVETQWRSYSVILCINISTNDIRVLTFDDISDSLKISNSFNTSGRSNTPPLELPPGDPIISNSWLTACPFSVSLIDCAINPGRTVVMVSSPTNAPRLASFAHDEFVKASAAATATERAVTILTTLSTLMGTMAISKGNQTDRCSNAFDSNRPLRSFVLHTRLVHPSYSTTIESVLLLPPGGSAPPPLLVSPHGGPHSAFSTAYVAQYHYLCAAGGFAILMVNYRGSTGFGKELLESLPGRIGTQDVFDVFAATESLLEVSAGSAVPPEDWLFDIAPAVVPGSPLVDSNKLGVMGGSHGGFLTAHCIGQRPLFFKAAVLRNPVTNVLANSMTSDIGDWCVVEGCGAGYYDFNKYISPTMSTMTQMYDCSPIRLVERVSTPVLLCIGAKDRRVPHHQGLEYYHALKSHSVLSDDMLQMKVYPEADHAIDKPNSEADQFISLKLWFERFLK